MMGCTLSDNYGSPLVCSHWSVPTLRNCILAFTTLANAVACGVGTSVELQCCDVYGNYGGDWVGCLEGQLGINGNICEDPLFCLDDNPEAPYTLHVNSACSIIPS